ncbi:MAG: flagellar export protein FliJ [Treponema sp.]|nr:flagellar export protein FliJ [Treponema sp.]
MKRFKFNLEKILQLREFREEECKLALGQAISVLNAIENKIKETALRRHTASKERFNNPADMASWDLYILRLEQEAEKLSQEAAQAEIVVEEKRALYLEASKDLKAMEKLKEKQKSEYRKEMFNTQMNEVDDITSFRRQEKEIMVK